MAEALSTLRWSEELSVGLDSLDEDHQLIVDLLARVQQAAAAKEPSSIVAAYLDFLTDYTAYHFHREELVLAACSFPELKAHRRAHQAAVDRLSELRARHQEQPTEQTLRELVGWVEGWVHDHLIQEDAQYVDAIRSNLQAAQAAGASVAPIPHALDHQRPSTESRAGALTGIRVLVVEDRKTLRWLLNAVFRLAGVSVIPWTADPSEALELVDSASIDIVVCSAHLPNDGGLYLLRATRDRNGRPLPFLFTVLEPNAEWKRHALAAGAAGYLDLPFHATYLIDAVEKLVMKADHSEQRLG